MKLEQIKFKGITYVTGLEIKCLDQKILPAVDPLQILINQIKLDNEKRAKEILLQCNNEGIFPFKNDAEDDFPDHTGQVTGINYSPRNKDLIYTLTWKQFETLKQHLILKVEDLIWYNPP